MTTSLNQKIAAYGNNRLAADVGVSPQAVSKWAKRGELPPRRVRVVAKLMGVSQASLSPEVFGPDLDCVATADSRTTPTPKESP